MACLYPEERDKDSGLKKFKKGIALDLDYKKAGKKPIPVRCIQITEPFEVETLEGVMRGKPGDWLIIGIHRNVPDSE